MADFNDSMQAFANAGKAKAEAADELRASKENPGVVEGMFNSFTSSLAESVGADPSPESIRAQKENPISSAVADLVGTVLPFGVVAKLGQTTKIAKGLDKVEDFIDSDKRPIAAGAARNTALFMPMEVGRVAAAQVVEGGANAEDIAADAVFNLVLEASFGGLGGFLRASGKKAAAKEGRSIKEKFKDTDQAKARDISKGIETKAIPEDKLPYARNQLQKLRDQIRVAEPTTKKIAGKSGKQQSYVAPLKSGKAQSLNRLFKPNAGEKSGIKVRRFVQGAADAFATKDLRDAALKRAGLHGVEEFVMYPRLITADSKKASATIHSTLTQQAKLTAVDKGVYVGKEKDGLYVVAKKTVGADTKRDKGDEYAIFKTDQPQLFAPKAKRFAEIQENTNAFLQDKPRVRNAAKPTALLDYGEDLGARFPLELLVDATEKVADTKLSAGKSAVKAATDQVLGLVGLETREGGGQFVDGVRRFVGSFLTPAMFQFKGNAIAGYVHGQARAIHARAQGLTNEIVFGTITESTDSLFGTIAKGAVGSGKFRGGKSVDKAIGQLDEKAGELTEFINLWARGVPFNGVQRAFEDGEISRRTYNAFKELQKLDDFVFGEVTSTQAAVGEKIAQSLKGHYGLSRKWEGSLRVFLRNEAGELLHVVGAKTRKAVETRADAIVAELGAKGVVVKRSDAVVQDTIEDIATESHIKLNAPESKSIYDAIEQLNERAAQPHAFKKREGIEGFQTDFTKEELIKRYQADIRQRLTYTAEITVDHMFEKELLALADEDMDIFNDLVKRINQMAGKTGAFNEGVNRVADRVLSDALGKNSANQITSTVNEFMHHWQLGSLNLSFPTLNALTFVQTVFPEVAYVTSIPKGRAARLYTFDAVQGSDGRPKGAMGIMDMARLTKASLRELHNPDPEFRKLFDRAMGDGIVDARFTETTNSDRGMRGRFKDALKSDRPFLNFGRELSNALPGGSERFARGQAFSTGIILGRDTLNLAEGSDELYRFAKTFTERTMFNYGTADRAQVMTGAVGSAFGLFKNWQTHYIWNMIEYAGEASRGNWAPLMWQMGGTMAMGGVRALPVYAGMESVSKLMTDESLMQNMYEGFGGVDPDSMGGGIVDALHFGIPAFAGLSMSGQASAPGSDPSRDMAMLFSFAQANRASNIGKAIGSAFDTWQATGQHPMSSQNVRDKMTLAFMPKSVARYASVVEDNAIKSLNTGNVSIEGLNTAEKMMVISGFMPLRQARQLAANQEAWQSRDKMQDKVQNFGNLWAEAQLARDSAEMNEIRRRLIIEGVPIDRVMASAMNRIANKTEDRSSERLDPEKVLELQRLGLIQR